MESKKIDKNTICEACLDFQNSVEAVINTEIVQIYNIVIGKNFQENSSVKICQECVEMFNKIIKFRWTCLQSQVFLEKYSEKTQIEVELLSENRKPETTREYEVEDVCGEAEMEEILPDIVDIKIEEPNVEDDILKVKYHAMFEKAIEISLTEEEARREFEKRKRKKKYLEATHKCEKCITSFEFAVVLENHMKKHDKDKGDFECWLCKTRFDDNKNLKAHSLRHLTKFLCHLCDYQSNNKANIADHYKGHAGITFSCEKCNQTFTKQYSYWSHMRIHKQYKKGEYKCDACGKEFSMKDKLIQHRYTHTEIRSYPCNTCGKSFNSKSSLLSHLRTHVEKTGEFYCVECNITFKTEYSLSCHLKNSSKHRDPALLRISCLQCPKRFENEDQLQSHVQSSHEKIPKHSCEVCGGRYVTRQGLNFHRRKAHEGYVLPLKYTCETCAKQFSSSSMLKNHRRCHTGERPFQCSQCEWNFTQKSSLRTHVRLKHLKLKRNAD